MGGHQVEKFIRQQLRLWRKIQIQRQLCWETYCNPKYQVNIPCEVIQTISFINVSWGILFCCYFPSQREEELKCQLESSSPALRIQRPAQGHFNSADTHCNNRDLNPGHSAEGQLTCCPRPIPQRKNIPTKNMPHYVITLPKHLFYIIILKPAVAYFLAADTRCKYDTDILSSFKLIQ